MQTVTGFLGEYAASFRYEALPDRVVHQAKRFIVDTIGCGIGGFDCEPGRIARDLADTVTSRTPATVLCSGQKTSPELAAFANDTMVRHLDFNDGFISVGSGHPSDSIAGLIAAAEMAKVGGRDLIAATILAYEVFGRVCDVWENKACGIDHVTIGVMASTTGVAWLLGLDRRQITEALNLAIVANVALNQTRKGQVSMWKGSAYANANRNAIFAAQLAQRGMTGPAEVFEGPHGFFKVISRKPFALEPFGGEGRDYRIMESSIKRFPLGQFSQTVVQAAIEARAGIDVAEIAEVNIRTLQTALTIMADPEKWRPSTRETADHSIPYTAAVALMFGTVDETHFDEKHLRDPKLLDLVSRVKCSVLEEANRREREMNLCEIDLILRSGARRTVRMEFHRGHWRNPMTDAEVESKFRDLAGSKLAGPRLDGLLGMLWRLELLPNVTAMMEASQLDGLENAA